MHMMEWQHAVIWFEFVFYILSFFMEINLKCYRNVSAVVYCIITNNSTFLTHWGWLMHICVNKLAYERFRWWLDACLMLRLYIWTSASLFLTGPLGINFSDIWGKMQWFSFQKMTLEISFQNGCQLVKIYFRAEVDNIHIIVFYFSV